MHTPTRTNPVGARHAVPALPPVQQTLHICHRDARFRIQLVSLISDSKNSSQSQLALSRRPSQLAMAATARPQIAVSRSSELDFQTNLPFAARQPLGDRAEQVPGALLNLYRCGVAVIKHVEEFKQALHAEVLANRPSPGDAQVHVHEGRRSKSVAACLQVAAIEIAVAVLVDRRFSRRRVAEAALRAENAAELNLPRQFHKAVGFEGVAESEIGRSVIECRAIVKNAGLGDLVAVAGKERSGSVCLARAGHVTFRVLDARIGHDRNDSPEAIRWEIRSRHQLRRCQDSN